MSGSTVVEGVSNKGNGIWVVVGVVSAASIQSAEVQEVIGVL